MNPKTVFVNLVVIFAIFFVILGGIGYFSSPLLKSTHFARYGCGFCFLALIVCAVCSAFRREGEDQY